MVLNITLGRYSIPYDLISQCLWLWTGLVIAWYHVDLIFQRLWIWTCLVISRSHAILIFQCAWLWTHMFTCCSVSCQPALKCLAMHCLEHHVWSLLSPMSTIFPNVNNLEQACSRVLWSRSDSFPVLRHSDHTERNGPCPTCTVTSLFLGQSALTRA